MGGRGSGTLHKSIALATGHRTKAEIETRLANEQKLKGSAKMPTPPKQLTDAQKKIFKNVVKQLKEADILCSLDSEILAKYAISVDMIAQMDKQIQEDMSLLSSSSFMSSRKQYMSEFFRCTNELCLSPQSRAKMANMAAQSAMGDPLADALKAAAEEVTEDDMPVTFDSVPDNLTIEIAEDET